MIAAGARAVGLQPNRTSFGLATERSFSHIGSVLGFFFVSALLWALGCVLVMEDLDVDPTWGQAMVGVLFAGTFAWYRWPVLVLSYVVPTQEGRETFQTWWLWKGPGHYTARPLIRHGALPHRNLLVLGVFFGGLLALAAAHDAPPRGAVPLPLVWAAFLVWLPLTVWLALVESRRLREAAGWAAPTPRSIYEAEFRNESDRVLHGTPPPDRDV